MSDETKSRKRSVTVVAGIALTKTRSIEEFVANPPEKMELVDGKLTEKDGMKGMMFSAGQIAKTQKLLPGFEIAVDELLN